mmetsp:Transcript_7622/g.18814  ORF Transcript_7622/g.18814 Transcript_7622/m.18814 type:complete len:703 (-) Transcript_7622:2417-4525(-)
MAPMPSSSTPKSGTAPSSSMATPRSAKSVSSSSSTPSSVRTWPLTPLSATSSGSSSSSSPYTPRHIVKQGSPQLNKPHHHDSSSGENMGWFDYVCFRFLRNFKWLILVLIGAAFIHIVRNPPTKATTTRTPTFSTAKSSSKNNSSVGSIRSSSSSSSSKSKSKTEKFDFPNGPPEPSMVEELENEIDIWSEDTTDGNNPSDDLNSEKTKLESQSDDSKKSTTETTTKSSPLPPQLKDLPPILQSYQPFLSPVLEDYINDNGNVDNIMEALKDDKVQVHLVVDVTTERNGVETSAEITASPVSKSMLEAIERSEYLQLTAVTFIQPNEGVGTIQIHPRRGSDDQRKQQMPLVYIVDFGSMDRDCHRLELVLERIKEQISTTTIQTQTDVDDPSEEEPMFLLMDFTGSTRQTKCDFLIQTQNKQSASSPRVRLAKRSIVKNRYFNFTSGQIYTGQVVPNSWDQRVKPVLHSPFALREGFVTTVFNVTQGEKVLEHARTIDVGMFWKRGDYSHYGFLRRQSTEVVKTLHHSKVSEDLILENQVGVAYSDEKGMEAGNIQYEYAAQLLSCRIVVVSQRDEYEDHWRLLESMASGALVMTDVMLAAPLGLKDRVNVVVYKDRDDLKNLIRYYKRHDDERKKIARKGYELAMGRHRCWHRMEELIFGKPLTHVDRPFDSAPPKEPRPLKIQWLLDGKQRDSSLPSFVV